MTVDEEHNLHPDWKPLEMPTGVCGDVLSQGFQKLERAMLAETATDEAREIAHDAYVFGLKVMYGFLQTMKANPTADVPFDLVFEQLGRDLSPRQSDKEAH